ncbi:MAG: insulinase family protein [Actinomycetia bacterium]|nr:insulinase family protein [Actinomycetota bacterium]MCG2795156.1 insulinase family protein [Actinomycetes bacterium]
MAESGLEKTELDTKVRVLTERVPGVRSVSLGIWMNAGSRDESERQYGLSHFLEHMLFKGTSRMRARDIAEAFDNLGADINAFTGRESTSVYTRALDEFLPRVMEITFDMVRHALLEPGDLDAERQVVQGEINMHADSPDELVHDYLAGVLWGDHPIGHSVLGDIDVIKGVSSESLSGFYRERYVGSRIVVAAAGAVDHERICGLVSEQLDGLDAGAPTVRDNSIEVPLTGRKIVWKETEQAHITIGSKGLSRNHPDRFALAVMDTIIGGSMSSRLFQRIREEMGLVYSIYSYSGLFMGMGMVGIYCGTQPVQAQDVIRLIEDELVKVRDEGFTGEELERTQKHIKGSMTISMEDSGHRMNRMAKTELADGEHLTVDQVVEHVESVTLDDLHRIFEETWGSVGASLSVIGPFEDDELCLSGRI